MAGLIDPTVTGRYPVILGDSLTGEGSNEIFTGVRYNHKPTLSSTEAPERARLKPSVPGKTSSYDLTYTDDDENYAYSGPRSTDDDQYVLYFDPARQAFVLDKVDSTFNMNITRMPGSASPDELSRRFPHLDVEDSPVLDSINVRGPVAAQKSSSSSNKPSSSSSAPGKPASSTQAAAKRKVEKKPPKNLAMPVAAAATAPKKQPPANKPQKKADDDDEDDDDDDDGGLMIEYPEGPPARAAAAKHNDFSPAFPTQRRFDDYMNQRESEADDADGESDDEMDMDFKLPSPVNKSQSQNGHHEPPPAAANDGQDVVGGRDEEEEDQEDGGTVDLEADLEKEMEIAFEDLANSNEEGGRDDESEISEED
ncbi:hypothetical protein LMH87_002130 [Akanthomyces muscarius]|uniref:Transcription elongation factor Eaf N-terminal domain-containing protein n=1 Tax=Akanthomyces muscarius TaxID=2231603 RepID=A0A9W8Q7W6_AKAMU|nr:hypothetical protein LMH87_002130 [Akanthomyces muscarius]KAJ4147618.1 hypothetical protein LMH87_002130 [Akanthomyces muscarius]